MNQSISDVALIYIVLVVLYGVECVAWIRPGCTGIATFFGRVRSPARSVRLAGNESGHLNLFGPAPFDATFIVEACPISLSPLGIAGFSPTTPMGGVPPSNTYIVCSWDQAQAVRTSGRDLVIADRLLARLGSVQTAQALRDRLRSIACLPAHQHGTAIEAFAEEQFDLAAIRKRTDQWRSATRNIKAWSTLLAIWIFVIGLLRWYGLIPGFKGPETLPIFLAGLFLIWWTTNAFIALGHRHLYPNSTSPGARAGRWKLIFTAMVSPAVSLRAADHLARHLLLLKHPLAVVVAVGPTDDLVELAAAVIRDLRYPQDLDISATGVDITPTAVDVTISKAAAEIAEHYRQTLLTATIKFCQLEGISIDNACTQPMQRVEGSVSYCPRCLEEFSTDSARCSSCNHRPSIRFIGQDAPATPERPSGTDQDHS